MVPFRNPLQTLGRFDLDNDLHYRRLLPRQAAYSRTDNPGGKGVEVIKVSVQSPPSDLILRTGIDADSERIQDSFRADGTKFVQITAEGR